MKTNLIIVALLLIWLLPSCVVQEKGVVESGIEPIPTSTGLEPIPTSTGLEQESYRIQAGDQLEIKFYYNSDLNDSVVVRTDGMIGLQLVGETQAAGLTISELDGKLTESYGHELLKPEINVNLRATQGFRIYVGGEVNSQGYIEMRTNMTPLQAVLNAGGFNDLADPSSTVVIRKDQNNKPVSIVVDLAMVLAGKNSDSDFLLLPDDIVYVPKLQ